MNEVHCTGRVDYNPKRKTDFGYEMYIDNDGEIQLVELDNDNMVARIFYISQRDIESMVSLIKESNYGR